MSKKYKVYLSLILSVFLVLAIGAIVFYESFLSIEDYKVPAQKEVYALTEGAGARKVADDLLGEHFYMPVVYLYLKRHPELLALKKGDYLIDGTKTLPQILKDMVDGNIVEKVYPTVAVIEGSTFESLLNKFKESGLKDDDFYKEIADPKAYMTDLFKDRQDLLEAIGGAHDSFEGLLMPATYFMLEKEPFLNVLRQSMMKMASYMAKAWPNRDKDLWLKNPYEALILASIVERETLVDDERAHVAAVFYNRLKKGMRLQTDPTVMYGLSPTFQGKLTKKHINKDTNYNTYTRDGLAPTPIAMPQERSIDAVLHPLNCKDLYFVAAGISPKMGHVFTSSLKDHNKAVFKYRKALKEYRKELLEKEKDIKEKEKTLKEALDLDKETEEKNKTEAQASI